MKYSDSVVITRPTTLVYEMVSDVTRMGDWSPVCRECWWDDGGGPRVGAGFTGRNVTADRTWETHSVVEAAEPGSEFAFVVGGGVRWGYTFESVEGGTLLTESWHFLPAGQAGYADRYGNDCDNQIAKRRAAAQEGISQTLASIKTAAERD